METTEIERQQQTEKPLIHNCSLFFPLKKLSSYFLAWATKNYKYMPQV